VTDASRRVREIGRAAGFDLVRIAEAAELNVERARYMAWLRAGRHAEMAWITEERVAKASVPESALKGVRSVIAVGMTCWGGHRPPDRPNHGRVARYAWGRDYHAVMGDRLRDFSQALSDAFGGDHRWYVDTGPVMDRAWAQRSGLGWYGKNSNILTEQFGSYVLLGEVLTTLPLTPDRPLTASCGSCSLCETACPTGAIGPSYSIDSRRCISYLTIEHRGPIPRELRPLIGAWVFGCDVCQDVCPPTMQHFVPDSAAKRAWADGVRAEMAGKPTSAPIEGPGPMGALMEGEVRPQLDLLRLLALTHDEYLAMVRGTSIRRAKCWMLRRNAAIALGNVGTAEAIEPLVRALRTDDHPVVRGHAAWALAAIERRLGIPTREHLKSAAPGEQDATVREEIAAGLMHPSQEIRA